jgi:outer membrane protein, heavy metal efflux system
MKSLVPASAMPWCTLLSIGIAGLIGCVDITQSTRYEELDNHVKARLNSARTAEIAEGDLFSGEKVLTRKNLIDAVLRRNSSMERARQAHRAALAQYPQSVALDDPMVRLETAPVALFSDRRAGHIIRVEQRFEWLGKRDLRGELALVHAAEREADLARVQLELSQEASRLFDDLFVLDRGLETDQRHELWLKRLKAVAESQYAAGRGAPDAALEVDLELALIERHTLALKSRRNVVVTRLNGLLHRRPNSPMPGMPTSLPPASFHDVLQADDVDRILAERPAVVVTKLRIDGAQTRAALARAREEPDIVVGASYNSMWAQIDHQFMVGLSLRLPFFSDRTEAAVEAAEAEVAMEESARIAQINAAQVEVSTAQLELLEAIEREALYRARILPASKKKTSAAEIAYESGQGRFAHILQSRHRMHRLEWEHAKAVADTWRRRADLDRAMGFEPGAAEGGAR